MEKRISQIVIETVLPSLVLVENINMIEDMLNSIDANQKALAEHCIAKNPKVMALIETRKLNPQLIKQTSLITKEEKIKIEKEVDQLVVLIKNLKNSKAGDILEKQIKIFDIYSKKADIDERLYNQLDLNNSFEKEDLANPT